MRKTSVVLVHDKFVPVQLGSQAQSSVNLNLPQPSPYQQSQYVKLAGEDQNANETQNHH